jgi:hypothetical protein
MRVIITGFDAQKKIMAIKGIRFAAGLGLKEAKGIADVVGAGTPTAVDVGDDRVSALDEQGVTYRVGVPLAVLIAALSDYPAGMRVGDLVRTLNVAKAAA